MNKKLSKDEEDQIRRAIEAIEEEEIRSVLEGKVAAVARDWADDLAVNAPNNQVMRKPVILDLMRQRVRRQKSCEEMVATYNC